MSFPVVESVTKTVNTTAATTRFISLPATINPGDLLILIYSAEFADTDVPSGWTFLLREQITSSPNTEGISIFYKFADGSEGPTVSVFTSSGTEMCAHVYRISGAAAIQGASVDGGSTPGDPNPPSLSPSWGSDDNLWVAVGMTYAGSAASMTPPTNYTGGEFSTSGVEADDTQLATAHRELIAASENPGTFDFSVNALWAAATLAIRPRIIVPVAVSGASLNSGTLSQFVTRFRSLTGLSTSVGSLNLLISKALSGTSSNSGSLLHLQQRIKPFLKILRTITLIEFKND